MDRKQMIADRRRAPFCFQTHDALDAIREIFEGQKRATALAIYLSLTETANRNGGAEARAGFQASRKEVSERAGVSTDTFDRYVAEFVEIGILVVVREQEGSVNLPNRWTLVDRTSAPPSRTGAATPSRTGAALTTRSKGSEVEEEAAKVSTAWRENAPPLIEHREGYFSAEKTATAVRVALRVYPVEAVEQAIRNYAAVLGGKEYRWSYSWTLIDFLKRGLDKFVPEADPLRNFRSNGRAGSVTGADFSHLPDL